MANSKSFNLLLDDQMRKELSALQQLTQCSGGQILRQALHAKYCHQILRTPSCASGQPCFVPHMHVPAQPFPQPANGGFPHAQNQS